MICKILGLFVKTLITDNRYSFHIRDNSTEPIQMHLSKKQKTFSHFPAAFLKSRLNSDHSKIRDDPNRLGISENRDCERCD